MYCFLWVVCTTTAGGDASPQLMFASPLLVVVHHQSWCLHHHCWWWCITIADVYTTTAGDVGTITDGEVCSTTAGDVFTICIVEFTSPQLAWSIPQLACTWYTQSCSLIFAVLPFSWIPFCFRPKKLFKNSGIFANLFINICYFVITLGEIEMTLPAIS